MSSRLRKLQTSRFDAMMLIRASTLFAVSFGLLVYGVGADIPCKRPDQIHWTTTEGKKYKCLECPDCPAGSQSSVPCGSSVPYGTPIHCIPCQLGKTYSDKYGKLQCEACTVCSKGKAVKKNCTLFSNTECDDKCAEGYYPAPFIFDCFVCSECCYDGKDEIAWECANYAKKCKVRSTACANDPTRASKTTTNRRRVSPVNIQKTSTALQTSRPGTLHNKVTTLLRTNHSNRPTSSVSPTRSGNNHYAVGGMALESREDRRETRTLLIVAIAVAVLAILILLVAFMMRKFSNENFRLPCYTYSNNSTDPPRVLPYNLRPPSFVSQEHSADDITLEQLESSRQNVFDRMCLKLDNGRWWFRRDYERLAAKFEEIPLEERNALRDQLQVEGGSPSKLLMSHLQTKCPNLPLRRLVSALEEIGRRDIVQLLMPFVRQNFSSAQ